MRHVLTFVVCAILGVAVVAVHEEHPLPPVPPPLPLSPPLSTLSTDADRPAPGSTLFSPGQADGCPLYEPRWDPILRCIEYVDTSGHYDRPGGLLLPSDAWCVLR